MDFLFLNNQVLAEHPRAWLFNCLLFPQQKKLCISRYFLIWRNKEKGRLPLESLPFLPLHQGNALAYWPLRMARLMLCTASTMAATDSGGVNWEMPWPRLNT